jgi:hypothetical protein
MSIAARSRWSESNYPSPDMFEGTPPANLPALSQPAWFIDPINGNDNNDGATVGTALQTLTQLATRWGKGNTLLPNNGSLLAQPTVTVTLLNNNVPSDIPNFDVILGANAFGPTSLVFQGTVLSSTPIAGPVVVVPKNRMGNTPWQLQTTAPAAGLVTGGAGGNNIRIVDNSFSPAPIMWGWKVGVGAPDTVVVSEPLVFPGFGNLATDANRRLIASGNDFELQTFTMTNFGELRIGGVRQGQGTPRVIFMDLCLGTTPLPTIATSIVSDGTVDFYYYECLIFRRMDAVATLRNMFFVNSQFSLPGLGDNLMLALSSTWTGGVINTVTMLSDANAFYRFDMDIILESCTLGFLQPLIQFGTCGIFDAVPAPAIAPRGAINCSSPLVQLTILNDTTAFLWGGGAAGQNPGVGVSVGANRSMRYNAFQGLTPANITLTGSAGDFALQGQTSSFAPAPIVAGMPNMSTGVTGGVAPAPLSVATFVGPFVNSWLNLAAGQPAGFGGTAVNPAGNAWIIPV